MTAVSSPQSQSPNGLDVKVQSGGRSGVLVVVFSQARIPAGKFGLERLFAKTQHSCVFFNDASSQWYLNASQEIDRAIEDAVASEKPARIIYYGASMGAYGALITGLRRQDGEVFAFSPEVELGLPDSQSAHYVAAPYPDKNPLLQSLSKISRFPVHLFFGLYDWIDTAGYLAVESLPQCDLRHCYGLAGPHALHDQLYSLNIIRRIIKTFERDLSVSLSEKKLIMKPEISTCHAFVEFGKSIANGQDIDHQSNTSTLKDNPGYGLLEAERLALLNCPSDGANLLLECHHRLINDDVMRTTPKRWRKQFLIRSAELFSSGACFAEARQALILCAGFYPVDEHMQSLAIELGISLPDRP
ncbi:hypothetical protein [Pseudovibrio sp. Tun.PSC04-5.I4]|uniref:hypothetical protein n=1 Tax=Pseudovibrio sp. Tun.PSC04-5.I4 TaxID=1798213 RepID=UPI000885BD17|nr:hypothetical protein [Pseudovibrio sp. Tun.PSC04-5.I4]SDR25774.1 hypothetical protein SAMN04515695_3854 [Pseudovibrio sp. Tun.PSC04-5.I4]